VKRISGTNQHHARCRDFLRPNHVARWRNALHLDYRADFLSVHIFPLDPRQLAPPYWINMGAMAISTLAGTIFAQNATASPLLTQLHPFIVGLTLLFWATATWWIPLLVVLGVWRHIIRHVSLTYDVVYWSAVFPLGMYTACTHRLVQVSGQPFLDVIPQYFIIISLAAWFLTLLGLLWRVFPRASASLKQ
jgi:tellurite resistance protein TehA-like permease